MDAAAAPADAQKRARTDVATAASGSAPAALTDAGAHAAPLTALLAAARAAETRGDAAATADAYAAAVRCVCA